MVDTVTVGPSRRRAGVVDLAVCLAFGAVAAWLAHGLWPDPATRALAGNPTDQALNEWWLANAARVWTHGAQLHTDLLNAPDGVNLMANASLLLAGAIMAPVTALWGPAVSFAVLTTLNLPLTAAGWYLLLARGLRQHRLAAAIGALVTGFAPGMLSQSLHLHMAAQWLVAPIVWCVILMARASTRRATIRPALGLAALVCAQVFLGEEVLFLTALALLVFAVAYGWRRREWARQNLARFATGMGLAAGVSAVVLAYPLWMQVAGPQHIPNAPFIASFYYADVASYLVFSPQSIAGQAAAGDLSTGPTELNTYLGLPLVAAVIAAVVWGGRRWPGHRPVLAAAGVTVSVLVLLSLGPEIIIAGVRTHVPGPYWPLAHVPIVEAALPTRYALAAIPLIALVLATVVDAALREAGRIRIAVPAATALVLAPLIPLPLATTAREPVPAFITGGGWRTCVPEGGVLVPVPVPTPLEPDTMRWPAAVGVAFALPEAFFIGPYGPGGTSSVGRPPRSTSLLLAEVARTGTVPPIGDAERGTAQADLEFWQADCVALAPVPQAEALRITLVQLLGPGTLIQGTWTWTP